MKNIPGYLQHEKTKNPGIFMHISVLMNEEKLVLLSRGVARGLALSPFAVLFISK